ncbi:DNA-processing protein DprA [Capnocytophaga bilenii]|jgi:SMF family protein
MKYTENALNVLTALRYKGIGKAWIVRNFKVNDSLEKLAISTKTTVEKFVEERNKVEEEIRTMCGFADGLIAFGDKDFPLYRGKVNGGEQPIFLLYKGNIGLLQKKNKNIAVIGLLQPDPYTEEIEQEVVSELVENGATIVSGLALGCDSIAHRQALKSGGKTVAILPSTLKNITPAVNKELAEEIVAKEGLLVTEYFTEPFSKMELFSRYKERDRLQALFSDTIVLTASYAKNNLGNDSGSRLAMEFATNYGIPRAVIYNPSLDEGNPKYDLNRQLMSEDEKIIIINKENFKTISKQLLKGNNTNLQTEQLSLF